MHLANNDAAAENVIFFRKRNERRRKKPVGCRTQSYKTDQAPSSKNDSDLNENSPAIRLRKLTCTKPPPRFEDPSESKAGRSQLDDDG